MKGRAPKFLVLFFLPLAFACERAVAPTSSGDETGLKFAQETIVLDGQNVIEYEHHDELANSVRYIIQGERLSSGGCSFSGEFTLDGNAKSVTELEMAFDPDTCRSLIERGTMVASGDSTDPDDTSSSSNTETVDAPSGSSTTVSASLGIWDAQLHGWFEDPPGIHVNDAVNTIRWEPDGTCADAGGARSCASNNNGFPQLDGTRFPTYGTMGLTAQGCGVARPCSSRMVSSVSASTLIPGMSRIM